MNDLVYSDIFGESWKAIKDDLALVAGLSLVYFFGAWVLAHIPLINFLVLGPLAMGYLRCLMQIRKKETIGYQDFFWGFLDFNRFLNIIILHLLISFGTALGFILLIVPGIWFVVSTLFAMSIFVTEKSDGITAIQKSIELCKGRWWNIAGFVLVISLINMAGVLCLGIGILLSIPISFLSMLIALEKLRPKAAVVEV
jgi:hypothetical protein